MAGSALDHLYKLLSSKPGSRITSQIEDKKTGRRIGFRADLQLNAHEREMFVATAFKYLPSKPETIGVMEKIAKAGAAEERHVLVYFDDRSIDNALVFHPRSFIEYGQQEAKQEERRQRGETWLNLDRSWGCDLRDFADGDCTPQTQPSKQEEVDRDGGWFSV